MTVSGSSSWSVPTTPIHVVFIESIVIDKLLPLKSPMFGITYIPVVGPGSTQVPKKSQSTTTTSSIIRRTGGSLKYTFISCIKSSIGGNGGAMGGLGGEGGGSGGGDGGGEGGGEGGGG